jgi:Coenzyme PQQ synthesis protein D (PqqD)
MFASEHIMSAQPASVRTASHVRSVIDADGGVLLDLKGGTYFSLNTIAATIWCQLETGHTVREIEESLVRKYEAPPEIITADLEAFLSKLVTAELIYVDSDR